MIEIVNTIFGIFSYIIIFLMLFKLIFRHIIYSLNCPGYILCKYICNFFMLLLLYEYYLMLRTLGEKIFNIILFLIIIFVYINIYIHNLLEKSKCFQIY
jgi:hypothetical protein